MTTPPTIPLFDPLAQYTRLRSDIDARVSRVLAQGRYVLGPEVEELETALAEMTGAPHVITVANGTDALTIALMAAGIGHGDAVFVPSFTYVATAGAVLAAGASPVFCDVDAATFTLDAADLARRIDVASRTLCPRAVIPVDLFGVPADYAAIAEVATAHDLLVLADAAQSFGAHRNGIATGALAPVTATSFYPTKPLGCFGDGGAVFAQDETLAARIRAIRAHGNNDIPGFNSRLDTMQATILLAKLATVASDGARRAEIAALYDAAFSGHVGLQRCPSGSASANAVYAILSENRDSLHTALTELGISSRAYYSTPIHLMPAYNDFSEGPGSLQVTERLSTQLLALPMYADLNDSDAMCVCDAVLHALNASPASITGT